MVGNFWLGCQTFCDKSKTDRSCRRLADATALPALDCANMVDDAEEGLWFRRGMGPCGRCHAGSLSILDWWSEDSLGSGTGLSGVGSVEYVGSVVIAGVDSGIALSRYEQMRFVCMSGEERVGLNFGHCSSQCRLYSRFG